MSLSFFPQPYPDELMYSVIARYHHISGNTQTYSMIDLFNKKSTNLSISLQARLGVIANNVEHLGISFDTLLLEHTMFPYLMVFTTPERYEKVYNWLKYSDNLSTQTKTNVSHRNMCSQQIMYCPECAKEDMLLFGEAYWHRMHQTPGIVICKKHKCYLNSILTPLKNNQYQLFQEEMLKMNYTRHDYEIFIHDCGVFDDTKFLFNNFLQVRKLFIDYNYCFRNAFLPKFISKKLGTKRNLKNKKIIEDFNNFYGIDYLKRIGLSVSDTKWPIIICRENVKHDSYALKYILMARFLFGSFENFFYEIQSKEPFIINPTIKKEKNINIKIRERHRCKWLEIIAQMPDKGRYAAQKLNKGTYSWLSKNDNKWLKEHLPERLPAKHYVKNIDWSGRDKELSQKVNSIVEDLKFVNGEPKRIYQASICKALLYNVPQNRNKLPLTSLAIKNAAETIEEYRLRCCYWIIDRLKEQGIQPTTGEVYSMLKLQDSKWKNIIESILIKAEK